MSAPTIHCVHSLEVYREEDEAFMRVHTVTVEADVAWEDEDGAEPDFLNLEAWCPCGACERYPFKLEDFTSLERQLAEDLLTDKYVLAVAELVTCVYCNRQVALEDAYPSTPDEGLICDRCHAREVVRALPVGHPLRVVLP